MIAVFLELGGGGCDSGSEVGQGIFQLLGFFGSESTFGTIPLDAVKFVIEPRTRFSEISAGDLPPGDLHQYVGQTGLGVYEERGCDCRFHIS